MLKIFLISSVFLLLPSATVFGVQPQQMKAISWSNKINQETLAQTSTISATRLEKQAQELFQKGDFSGSIPLLEAAIQNYANQGDNYGQVRAIRNLGLVYLKLSEWNKSEATLNDCLNLIQQISNKQKAAQLTASVLEVKGQLQLSIGKSEAALDTWEEASQIYQKLGNFLGLTRSNINQAQALQALGLYSQALKQLKIAEANLEDQPDSIVKAKALQSLGDVLRGIGQLKASQAALESSLTIAENLQASEEIAIILISLGNTAILLDNSQRANLLYERAVQISPVAEIKIQALLNQLSLSIEQKKYSLATELVTDIDIFLNQLPISQPSIYAKINLAKNLIRLRKSVSRKGFNKPLYSPLTIADYLVEALQEAQKLGYSRAESYALGNLGNLYENNQQWKEAQELTEKALNLAQSINAADIVYQWEWQLGRILTAQENKNEAIIAYSQAVESIRALRSDIVAVNSELKFDFRDSVEPVYREFVDLLLAPSESEQTDTISQENLRQARQVIEALQLAELDNFFRNACLDTQPVEIDQVDKNAAILYTIVLEERLAVILAIPEKPLIYYSNDISKEEVDSTVATLLNALTNPQQRLFVENYWEPAQEIYNWLISPIEKQLEASQIETLVFVSEGNLRNVPLASLYDGEQYLAEKYSIAIAPSLELIDPQPLARKKLEILSMGITEGRQGFPPLPNVRQELKDIQSEATSKILLNEAFTEQQANTQVANTTYQVIHIATHGEFSSNVEDTFILTWDEKINVEELRTIVKSGIEQARPVELLVLSACRTAAGDNRATLGLAGIAVRAGARSTIASLWYVSDEATAVLMKNLYQQLTNPEMTKAEALRQAQEQMLKDAQIGNLHPEFAHPYFWSTFILVGNWL
ncbi:MAG: CHAT domain-containing protein [Trichodesmium sp.]